jgi:hypothetical protein
MKHQFNSVKYQPTQYNFVQNALEDGVYVEELIGHELTPFPLDHVVQLTLAVLDEVVLDTVHELSRLAKIY